MYCKKCGREQKDGQKFCPKCGEPFLDENGKPYLRGIRKDLQDAKDKLTSKADELTKQGKKLVEEKVQPKLQETINDVKNTDWNEKQSKVSSIIKNVYNKFINSSTATKFLVIGCALLIIYLLFGKFNSSDSGIPIFQGEPPQEKFINLLDDPSTAFTVRIDNTLGSNGAGVGLVEVPEGEGSKDDSYIWTLIFFPEGKSKTSGRAVIEPWLIDRKAWANAFIKTYRYEVRDGLIELYNGYNPPTLMSDDWTRCSDIRFYIEKENEIIILRGEFSGKERLFKQSQYIAASDKNRHYVKH